MITLFHHPNMGSQRFIFLMEEFGVPYEIRRVSVRKLDGSGGPDPENPHPHGKVPAILHNGQMVFESAGVALYLTDAFPEKLIGPLAGDPMRGAYVSWLAYYCGVVEPSWVCKFRGVDVPRTMAGWPDSDEVMAVLAAQLGDKPYLLGDRLTALDILLAPRLDLFLKWNMPLVPKTPQFEAYAARVLDRPSYRKALELDAG